MKLMFVLIKFRINRLTKLRQKDLLGYESRKAVLRKIYVTTIATVHNKADFSFSFNDKYCRQYAYIFS